MTHEINKEPKFEVGEKVAFLEEHISGWNGKIRKNLIRDVIKTVNKDKIVMESDKTWSRKVENYYGAVRQTYASNLKVSLISNDYANQIATEIEQENNELKLLNLYRDLGIMLQHAKSAEEAQVLIKKFSSANRLER